MLVKIANLSQSTAEVGLENLKIKNGSESEPDMYKRRDLKTRPRHRRNVGSSTRSESNKRVRPELGGERRESEREASRKREREKRGRERGGGPLSWQVQQHAIVARRTRSTFVVTSSARSSDSQSLARCFITLSWGERERAR